MEAGGDGATLAWRGQTRLLRLLLRRWNFALVWEEARLRLRAPPACRSACRRCSAVSAARRSASPAAPPRPASGGVLLEHARSAAARLDTATDACVDGTGRTLQRRQVELSPVEGPAGELPGLREAPARELAEGGERAGDDRGPAVEVELAGVLAREAAGAREPEEEGAVDRLLREGGAGGGRGGVVGRGVRDVWAGEERLGWGRRGRVSGTGRAFVSGSATVARVAVRSGGSSLRPGRRRSTSRAPGPVARTTATAALPAGEGRSAKRTAA